MCLIRYSLCHGTRNEPCQGGNRFISAPKTLLPPAREAANARRQQEPREPDESAIEES
jgi:hypothetical protein